jgi:hypothetical protein
MNKLFSNGGCSVSIAPPKAGRGTECAQPELSMRGAPATHQGSSPKWAKTRVARNGEQAKTVNAAPGATRLEPGPKGTRKSRALLIFQTGTAVQRRNVIGT